MRSAWPSRIQTVEMIGTSTLLFAFDDGETRAIDFQPVIDMSGFFSPLSDPTFFQQVQVGGAGRFLSWPGEINFCADALRMQGFMGVPRG